MPRQVMGYRGKVAGFRQILAECRRKYGALIEKKEAALTRPRRGSVYRLYRNTASGYESRGWR